MKASRRLRTATAAALLTAALLPAGVASSGCRRQADPETDQATWPRPYGWPRLAEVAPDYAPVADSLAAPLSFEINSHAEASRPAGNNGGARWIDIAYRPYGATLHLTLTRAAAEAEATAAIDNRLERLSLNSDPALTRRADVRSADGAFAGIMAVTPAGSATPVQFVVSGGRGAARWVVSGAVHYPAAASAKADSVAPAVETLARDVAHTISTLTVNP